MENKAFSAGVVPGGLRDKNEIKILICYLIFKIENHLKKSDITLVLQTYGIANYFEVSEAVSELELNGSIKSSEEGYEITNQGKIIVDELSKNIPAAVRNKALQSMISYIERVKLEKENKVVIKETKFGYEVICTVSGGEFNMMQLTLYAPDKEFSNAIKNNFYKNPGKIYNRIMSLLMNGNLLDD